MDVDHIFPQTYNDRPELKDYVEYLTACGFDTKHPDYVENYLPSHRKCNGIKSNDVDPFVLANAHQAAGKMASMILKEIKEYNKRLKPQ